MKLKASSVPDEWTKLEEILIIRIFNSLNGQNSDPYRHKNTIPLQILD